MVTIIGITWMEIVAYFEKNTYQVQLPSVDQMFFYIWWLVALSTPRLKLIFLNLIVDMVMANKHLHFTFNVGVVDSPYFSTVAIKNKLKYILFGVWDQCPPNAIEYWIN